MGALLTADGLLALATLSAMEIVLGIDNVVFIAILVGRLPEARRELARRLGLILALAIRILLLFAISWMMGLTTPLVTVLGHGVSGRDRILLGGGLFLIFKATWEIYDKVEAGHHEQTAAALRELIVELDSAMQMRFEATFRAVAAEFERSFTRLFGGGQAQLPLALTLR